MLKKNVDSKASPLNVMGDLVLADPVEICELCPSIQTMTVPLTGAFKCSIRMNVSALKFFAISMSVVMVSVALAEVNSCDWNERVKRFTAPVPR